MSSWGKGSGESDDKAVRGVCGALRGEFHTQSSSGLGQCFPLDQAGVVLLLQPDEVVAELIEATQLLALGTSCAGGIAEGDAQTDRGTEARVRTSEVSGVILVVGCEVDVEGCRAVGCYLAAGAIQCLIREAAGHHGVTAEQDWRRKEEEAETAAHT